MTTRETTLSDVWPDDEKKFGELTVQRPTPHRINVLMRRRNMWASDNPREQTELEAMTEWLFVLSRTKQELTAMFRDTMDQWEMTVDSFLADHGDIMTEWETYLTEILKSMQAGAIEPESPGKPKAEQHLAT